MVIVVKEVKNEKWGVVPCREEEDSSVYGAWRKLCSLLVGKGMDR